MENKKEKRIQLDFVDSDIDVYLLEQFCIENNLKYKIIEDENGKKKISLEQQLNRELSQKFEKMKHDFKSQFPRKEAKYDKSLSKNVLDLLNQGVEVDYDIICNKGINNVEDQFSTNHIAIEREILISILQKYNKINQEVDIENKIKEFENLDLNRINNDKIRNYLVENKITNDHYIDALLKIRLSDELVKVIILINEIDEKIKKNDLNLKQSHIDIINSFFKKADDILKKYSNIKVELINGEQAPINENSMQNNIINTNINNNNNMIFPSNIQNMQMINPINNQMNMGINMNMPMGMNKLNNTQQNIKKIYGKNIENDIKYLKSIFPDHEKNDNNSDDDFDLDRHTIYTPNLISAKIHIQRAIRSLPQNNEKDQELYKWVNERIKVLNVAKGMFEELKSKVENIKNEKIINCDFSKDNINNKLLTFDKNATNERFYTLNRKIENVDDLKKINQSLKNATKKIFNNLVDNLSFVDLNANFDITTKTYDKINNIELIRYYSFKFDIIAKALGKEKEWSPYKQELVQYYIIHNDSVKEYYSDEKDKEFNEASKAFFQHGIISKEELDNENNRDHEFMELFKMHEIVNIHDENVKNNKDNLNDNINITEFEKKNATWQDVEYIKMLDNLRKYLKTFLETYKNDITFVNNGYVKIITSAKIKENTKKNNKNIITAIPNKTNILRQSKMDKIDKLLDQKGGKKVLPFDGSLINFIQKICLSAFDHASLFQKNKPLDQNELKLLSFDFANRFSEENKNDWSKQENKNLNNLSIKKEDIDIDKFIKNIKNICKDAYENDLFWQLEGSFNNKQDCADYFLNQALKNKTKLMENNFENEKKLLDFLNKKVDENNIKINKYLKNSNDILKYIKNLNNFKTEQDQDIIFELFSIPMNTNTSVDGCFNTIQHIFKNEQNMYQIMLKDAKQIPGFGQRWITDTMFKKEFYKYFIDVENVEDIVHFLAKVKKTVHSDFDDKNNLKELLGKVKSIKNNTLYQHEDFITPYLQLYILLKGKKTQDFIDKNIISNTGDLLVHMNELKKEGNQYLLKELSQFVKNLKITDIDDSILKKCNLQKNKGKLMFFGQVMPNISIDIDKYCKLEEYEKILDKYINHRNDISDAEKNIIEAMKNMYKKKQKHIENIEPQINKLIDVFSCYILLYQFFVKQCQRQFVVDTYNTEPTDFIENQEKVNIQTKIDKKLSLNNNLFKINHNNFKRLFNNISEIVGIPNGCDFDTKFEAIKPYLKRMLEFNINKISNTKNKEEAMEIKQEAINLTVDKANITNPGQLQDKYNLLCNDIFNSEQADEEKIDFKKINNEYKDLKKQLGIQPNATSPEYQQQIEEAKREGYFDFYNKEREIVSTMMMIYGEQQGKHYDNNKMQQMDGEWLDKDRRMISGEKLSDIIENKQKNKEEEAPKLMANVSDFNDTDSSSAEDAKNYMFAKNPYGELLARNDNSINTKSKFFTREALVQLALNLCTIDAHKNNFFYQFNDTTNKAGKLAQFDFDYTDPMIPLDVFQKYNKKFPDRIDILKDYQNATIVKKEIHKRTAAKPFTICSIIKYRVDRTYKKDPVNENDLKNILIKHILHCCTIIDALCKTSSNQENVETKELYLGKDCFYTRYNGKKMSIQQLDNQNNIDKFTIKIPSDLIQEYKDSIQLLSENITECVNFIENHGINQFLEVYKQKEKQEIKKKHMKKLQEKFNHNDVYIVYDNNTNSEKKYLEIDNDYYEYSEQRNQEGYHFNLVDKNDEGKMDLIRSSVQIRDKINKDDKGDIIDITINGKKYNLFSYNKHYFYQTETKIYDNKNQEDKKIYGVFSDNQKVEEHMQKELNDEMKNGIEMEMFGAKYDVVFKWGVFYLKPHNTNQNFEKATSQQQSEIENKQVNIIKNNKNTIKLKFIHKENSEEFKETYYGKMFGKYYKIENNQKLQEISQQDYDQNTKYEKIYELAGTDNIKVYKIDEKFFYAHKNNDDLLQQSTLTECTKEQLEQFNKKFFSTCLSKYKTDFEYTIDNTSHSKDICKYIKDEKNGGNCYSITYDIINDKIKEIRPLNREEYNNITKKDKFDRIKQMDIYKNKVGDLFYTKDQMEFYKIDDNFLQKNIKPTFVIKDPKKDKTEISSYLIIGNLQKPDLKLYKKITFTENNKTKKQSNTNSKILTYNTPLQNILRAKPNIWFENKEIYILNDRLYIVTNKNPKTLTQINKYIDNKIIKFNSRIRSKTTYILNQCCNDSNLKKVPLYNEQNNSYKEYFFFKTKDDNLKLIYTEDQKEIQDKKILNDLYKTAAYKFNIENYKSPYEINKVSKKLITMLKQYNFGNEKTKINYNSKKTNLYKKMPKTIKTKITKNDITNVFKIYNVNAEQKNKTAGLYGKLDVKRINDKVNEGINAYYKYKQGMNNIIK